MPPVTPAVDDGYTFISHAAPDKRGPVKLLVRALAREGLQMFIDRPWPDDESCMGLSHDFIRYHRIRGIPLGEDWKSGLLTALAQSRAVLLCLSASAEAERLVLQQEAVVAAAANKLLTCVIDGSAPGSFEGDWGMADVNARQTMPLNMAELAQALDWLDADPTRTTAHLPAAWRPVWDSVALLASHCRSTRPFKLDDRQAAGLHALRALFDQVQVPAGAVRIAFRAALANNHRGFGDIDTLSRMLVVLSEMEPSPARPWPPLLEFVLRLSQQPGLETLLDWVKDAGDHLQLAALRRHLDREAAGQRMATIVIDLDDDLAELTWNVHGAGVPVLGSETVPLATPVESGLPQALGRVLACALDRIRGVASARVALHLSARRLADGLDALSVSLPGDAELDLEPEPICRRWPVTLHWRNRALWLKSAEAGTSAGTQQVPMLNWQTAINALKSRGSDAEAATIVWSLADAEQLKTDARQLVSAGGQGACLGLGGQISVADSIKRCLGEGVPCVVWFRQSCPDSDAHRSAVSAVFEAGTPAQAPFRAGERRLQADPAFQQLSILWDTRDHLEP